MGLSSAAARCGLYTASRTGFSSNRQLSVLPALNAYKPTLHVLFFCFVSHYSSAACNIQFIFQENLSWSAQLSNNRMHALRAFYCHLGTFSRRGAVALATIYPCAECASSRSIFIVWKRSFLYDKKECVEVHAPAAASRVSDIFHSAAVRSAQKRLSGVSREPFLEFCILIAGRRSSFRLWA